MSKSTHLNPLPARYADLNAAMAAGHGLAEITEGENGAAVRACHGLMLALRPHLGSAEDWLLRFRRQAAEGYRLFALVRGGEPVALAGFRQQENLVYGTFLYVDDLITRETERSSGAGAVMMACMQAEASRLAVSRLVLDTALANVRAHRFYYRSGLLAQGLRFGMPVESPK